MNNKRTSTIVLDYIVDNSNWQKQVINQLKKVNMSQKQFADRCGITYCALNHSIHDDTSVKNKDIILKEINKIKIEHFHNTSDHWYLKRTQLKDVEWKTKVLNTLKEIGMKHREFAESCGLTHTSFKNVIYNGFVVSNRMKKLILSTLEEVCKSNKRIDLNTPFMFGDTEINEKDFVTFVVSKMEEYQITRKVLAERCNIKVGTMFLVLRNYNSTSKRNKHIILQKLYELVTERKHLKQEWGHNVYSKDIERHRKDLRDINNNIKQLGISRKKLAQLLNMSYNSLVCGLHSGFISEKRIKIIKEKVDELSKVLV